MIDPAAPSASSPAEEIALTIDAERAEAILHDVAVELLFVSLARGAALHVRALALKREVARWRGAPPPAEQRQAAIDELLALHEEVKKARRHGA